jgi:hypothetical protein
MNLLVVGGLAERQRLERQPLLVDPLGVAGVAAADNLVDETAPCRERPEVARGAQQQRVGQLAFEVAVGALDRAVFVCGLVRFDAIREGWGEIARGV